MICFSYLFRTLNFCPLDFNESGIHRKGKTIASALLSMMPNVKTKKITPPKRQVCKIAVLDLAH